jgi:hypothetical protein
MCFVAYPPNPDLNLPLPLWLTLHLLVVLNIEFGLLPLASRDTTLEHNVNLAVR